MPTALLTAQEMGTILGDAIAELSIAEKAFLQDKLIPLRKQVLNWEYGEGEPYDAWTFADFKERNVGAVFCRGGFGAMGCPWGLVFLNDNHFGMDSGWYQSLGGLLSDGWVENAT